VLGRGNPETLPSSALVAKLQLGNQGNQGKQEKPDTPKKP
jgi:hypothetical protein